MSDNTPYLEKEFGSGRVAITQLLVAMIALDESFVEFVPPCLNLIICSFSSQQFDRRT